MTKTAAPSASRVPPPMRWSEDGLLILDQRKLPGCEAWLSCGSAADVADAIGSLAIRGAPGIAIAAAFGLVLATKDRARDRAQLESDFGRASKLLLGTRPTAVNLRWAIEQGRDVFAEAMRPRDPGGVHDAMVAWAERLIVDQLEIDRRLAAHGMLLLAAGDRVLTHCHTGRLATGGLGTAAGVLQMAHEAGRLAKVWVDETRPLLQGARLTAWELGRAGVPYTLVTDSSAGLLMAQGLVDRVVVGADRVAANGDVANKIGTYALAVLAWHHAIPFYVVAPCATLDPQTDCGAAIVLERRDPDEVRALGGTATAPSDAPTLNMAFDVTPGDLVSAIVTEVGTLQAPYGQSIAWALAQPAVTADGPPASALTPSPACARARRSIGAGGREPDVGATRPPRPARALSSVLTGVDADLVQRLATMGRSFYARGWLPGTAGNFSAVIARTPLRVAVTATGVDVGNLSRADLVVVDERGTVLDGARKPSNEVALHLSIRRARPGAAVVLHTHSTWSTLASVHHDDGVALTGYEQLKGLASVRSPEYGEWLPILDNDQALQRLARSAEVVLRDCAASHGLLLRGHGLYTWGTCLAEAQRHVETLEFLLEIHERTANTSNGREC